jgi:hypothetical protein
MKVEKQVIEYRIKQLSKFLGFGLIWKKRSGVYGPYIHALMISSHEYFNGGTGTYYTLKGFDEYIEGMFHFMCKMEYLRNCDACKNLEG